LPFGFFLWALLLFLSLLILTFPFFLWSLTTHIFACTFSTFLWFFRNLLGE
jgi:hypothetical protein